MKTAAIICEYNPFHNGHRHHIAETRRLTNADFVVAIMSGNYVQRGEVALFPKKYRAEAAIAGGVDLVLELPSQYSCASAEFFALGAIKLLNALGTVDCLSFGAETPDISKLYEIAKLLSNDSADFSSALKEFLSAGDSFPVARAKAIKKVLGKSFAETISLPNNILSIEYLKALISTNSSISPVAVQRTGARHDSLESIEDIASASHIRKIILDGDFDEAKKYMPDFASDIFSRLTPFSITNLEGAIISHITKMKSDELALAPDVSEGLENRIKSAVLSHNSLKDLVNEIKTKRYTHSRIRRILLSAFLEITRNMQEADPQYIKILAHNERGQKLISLSKKTASLPLVRNTSQINKLNNPVAKDLWEQERIFDRIYELSKG